MNRSRALVLLCAVAIAGCGSDESRSKRPGAVKATRDEITLGDTIHLEVAAGDADPATIRLERNPYPYTGWIDVPDGAPGKRTVVFEDKPRVNTRYRAVASPRDVHEAIGPETTVYVDPRGRTFATAPGPHVARYGVSFKLGPNAPLQPGRVYFYLRRTGKPFYVRLGSSERFPVIGNRVGAVLSKRITPHRRDKFFTCVRVRFSPAMGRQGRDAIIPACGERRLPYPAPEPGS